jgi:hypothetical protein
MKYLQLFCELPSEEFLLKLLTVYGIHGLNDTHEFCKGDLIELNTVDKLVDMIPDLIMYYLPCKANIYLNDITEKRAITILSQFLKLFKYRLLRGEKIINRKKIIFYRIQRQEDSKCKILRADTMSSNYEVVFR